MLRNRILRSTFINASSEPRYTTSFAIYGGTELIRQLFCFHVIRQHPEYYWMMHNNRHDEIMFLVITNRPYLCGTPDELERMARGDGTFVSLNNPRYLPLNTKAEPSFFRKMSNTQNRKKSKKSNSTTFPIEPGFMLKHT